MNSKTKSRLTNEKVLGNFKSSFDLVNYAIRLAENMIHTGRGARVKSDIENRAILILEEIYQGKDKFDEIPPPSLPPADFRIAETAPKHTARTARTEQVEKKKHRLSDEGDQQ